MDYIIKPHLSIQMYQTEQTDSGHVFKYPNTFSRYTIEQTIGKGASSIVVLVHENITKHRYAAKIVARDMLVSENRLQYFDRELRILQSIQHPNIIKVFDIIYLDEVIFVIMEYCNNGDLLDYISNRESILPIYVRQMFCQLVGAVNYLHNKGIVHRDLKPENIFIDGNYNIKLGDFGVSNEIRHDALMSTLCGTLYYTSPEVIERSYYDGRKADVWSLGILLFCMYVGALPWVKTEYNEVREEIKSGKLNFPKEMVPEVEEIIRACTKLDPNERPTCEQILNYPWVKQYYQRENSRTIRSTTSLKVKQIPKPKSDIIPENYSFKQTQVASNIILKTPIRMVNSDRKPKGQFMSSSLADIE